ncbi:hypothetical protein EEL32_12090 [Brevibacillus laterosporus]|nr:hypothetical protein [Brevibacillus laterosporus]TPG86846.1 hypothetical protein EEL32_12090 [Brevibacillus laterosporus]
MKEMLDGLDEEELYHIVNGMLHLADISLEKGDIFDSKRKKIIAKKVSEIRETRQSEQAKCLLNREVTM